MTIENGHQVGPDREQIEIEEAGMRFEVVSDPEWDDSHLSFKTIGKDCIWRVPRAEMIHALHGDNIPNQPMHGSVVALTRKDWFVRRNDGYWYRCGSGMIRRNRWLWRDLVMRYCEDGSFLTFMQFPNTHRPIMIPRMGPVDFASLPDMSSGEPEPGWVANVTKDGGLNVIDARTNNSFTLPESTVTDVLALYFRTMANRQEESDDNPGDSGDA